MLTANEWPGHVTLVSYARECVAELLAQHAENETLRAGYAAARLEIESLQSQLHAAKQINAAQFRLLAASIPGSALRASHGQAPAGAGEPTEQQILEAAFAPAQPAVKASRFGSPELQAMIVARCVEKDQADSVREDAACWQWLAEYLVGTRTDLDDEIVASETVNDLRKLVGAAIKQGATQ